jgi:hypothetical protein
MANYGKKTGKMDKLVSRANRPKVVAKATMKAKDVRAKKK